MIKAATINKVVKPTVQVENKTIKSDSIQTDKKSAIPKDFVYIPTVFPSEPSRFDEVYSYFPHWDMSSYKGDKLK